MQLRSDGEWCHLLGILEQGTHGRYHVHSADKWDTLPVIVLPWLKALQQLQVQVLVVDPKLQEFLFILQEYLAPVNEFESSHLVESYFLS